MRHVRYAIIGGGISGASLLHALASRGEDVLLFEQENRLGGVIGSEMFDQALIERGPNTLQTGTPELEALIRELDLTDQIISPDGIARHRYVLRDGKPVSVPTGPRQLIETELLSLKAKLRLLREWFLQPEKRGEQDESVASFISRHFGTEPLTYGVDPFVSGIYAGDPARLSLRHTFPLLADLEREYGSVLKGMVRRGKERKKQGLPRNKREMISFRGGLQAIPGKIQQKWGEKMLLGAEVKPLEHTEDGWRVVAVREGGIEVVRAEEVVLALNSPSAADLVEPVSPKLAGTLRGISYAPVALAYLLYDRRDIGHPLDGFGLLVPAVEKRKILGVIFSSSIFPARVPEGKALLTLFIGGARQPELTEGSSDAILSLAHAEASEILSINGSPVAGELTRWPVAIPQYNIGYDRILEGLREGEDGLPGLHLIGSYRGGVSVPDCVKNAFLLADSLCG